MGTNINQWLTNCTRRRFLGIVAGGTGVTVGPMVLSPFAWSPLVGTRSSRGEERAVVIIQLTGGNDALNTVIPFEDPAYHRARPTLRSVTDKAKPVSDSLALHSAFAPCEELLKDKVLTILQGVGYPNSSRDHGQALRDWQTAVPGDPMERAGWVGRACDHLAFETFALAPAVFVGTMQLPLTLVGTRSIVPTIRRVEDLIPGISAFSSASTTERTGSSSSGRKNTPNPRGLREFLQRTAAAADQAANRVAKVLEKRAIPPVALRYELQRRLEVIATIIEARVGIQFFYTDLGGPEPGGFDTHANQADNHAALLTELAWGLAHFHRRTEASGLSQAVLVMTFSEFGRTLHENGRRGTDHGAATCLFLLGGGLKGGIIGAHPSLTNLDQGGLRYHTDFRSLYRTMLEDWLGIPAAAIFGWENFAKLPILKPEAALIPSA